MLSDDIDKFIGRLIDRTPQKQIRVYRPRPVPAKHGVRKIPRVPRHDHRSFLELPSIQAPIIGYARFYTASLNSVGIVPPVAILASLVHVKGKRLLQDFIGRALAVDLRYGALKDDCSWFSEAVFETVPTEDNESATLLTPLLNHLANAAGLASSPHFDADGNYTLKFRIGL